MWLQFAAESGLALQNLRGMRDFRRAVFNLRLNHGVASYQSGCRYPRLARLSTACIGSSWDSRRSKQELQRQLNFAPRQGVLDLSEGWWADVIVRQSEIRMVEHVEKFRPELQALRFPDW